MRFDHSLPHDLRARLRRWAEESNCRLLVLFGSGASGDGAPGDVDLAVSLPELPSPESRLAMIGELQDLVGAGRADVVFLRPETDPVLRFEIFRRGVPLYESRPGLFVDEVVRALAGYEDALPFRRALRERLTRPETPA
jgi:predicted nucleotidyltransferase